MVFIGCCGFGFWFFFGVWVIVLFGLVVGMFVCFCNGLFVVGVLVLLGAGLGVFLSCFGFFCVCCLAVWGVFVCCVFVDFLFWCSIFMLSGSFVLFCFVVALRLVLVRVACVLGWGVLIFGSSLDFWLCLGLWVFFVDGRLCLGVCLC